MNSGDVPFHPEEGARRSHLPHDEDGDAMHVHDEDMATRSKPVVRHDHENYTAWQAASRAVAAGQLSGHEPKSAIVHLQRLAGNSGVGSLLSRERDDERSPVLDVVGKGGGTPIPADVRTDMEAHLDADFSDVRIHDGGEAARSAQAVQAKAYTVGNDVVFGRGAYDPGSETGRHTLAHELTHVVQQRAGPVDATPAPGGIAVSHPDDRFEREAEASADAMGGACAELAPGGHVDAAPVQRQEVPEEEEEEPADVQSMALQRQGPEEEEEPIEA